jgi:hypothetical protein
MWMFVVLELAGELTHWQRFDPGWRSHDAVMKSVRLPGVHKALTLFLQATLLIGVILFCAQGRWLTAAITAALEGDRLGYSYALRFQDGGTSNFVTEKGYLQRGDCFVVERGQYANIRRVANALCDGDSKAVAEQSRIRDAEQCHAAKEQLLAATSDEEIEIASRKVSIICGY